MTGVPAGRPRDWIRAAERAEPQEQWALLCFIAGREVALDERDLQAELGRAECGGIAARSGAEDDEIKVVGGADGHREGWYGRAVTALALDLGSPTARDALAAGLSALAPEVEGLRGASEALRLLEADHDLAWQCFAMALLADALADED